MLILLVQYFFFCTFFDFRSNVFVFILFSVATVVIVRVILQALYDLFKGD